MSTTRAGILRREVYIVDGVRTPVGKFGRSLKDIPATDLTALTLKELINRVGVRHESIDIIIYGHVIRAGTGMNTAKHAALKAGFPEDVDASNVDMVCASGMRAVIDAATYIASGTVDVAIAGGMESMSTAPFILPYTARWGYRLLLKGKDEILDAMIHDGLRDPIHGLLMGQEADETAWEYAANREELDEIAFQSHMKAAKAWDSGVFRETTIPVEIGGRVLLEEDEGIRRDTSREKLARLPSVFTSKGPHTAGNSSQISDGAVSILLASRRAVEELGLKPKAVIRAWSIAGVKPTRFPVAPVKAIRVLLDKLGWSIDEVDLWENNEAFAINSYILNRDLGIPYEKLNIHGGSIAIGHPLGSTGARLTLELVNALNIKQAKKGVASICHGLGGATAIAVERL